LFNPPLLYSIYLDSVRITNFKNLYDHATEFL
jgi:hypothetical protein